MCLFLQVPEGSTCAKPTHRLDLPGDPYHRTPTLNGPIGPESS